jgi:hypothetical protein
MPAELYPPDFRVRPTTRPLTSRFREITTRRTVTMPNRVSPHVKLVFAEMAATPGHERVGHHPPMNRFIALNFAC